MFKVFSAAIWRCAKLYHKDILLIDLFKNICFLYTNQLLNPDLDVLTKNLSRKTLQDKVIDWPLNLGLHHGFEPEGLVKRAVRHIAGVRHKIKNAFNYIGDYETTLRQQDAHKKGSKRGQLDFNHFNAPPLLGNSLKC